MSKTLKTWSSLKRGQRVRLVSDTCHHAIPLGTYTMRSNGVSTSNMTNPFAEYSNGAYVSIRDIVVGAETVEEMKKSLADMKKEYVSNETALKAKIKFCEEHGVDEYDDDLFKVHATLSILESTDSKLEKAKIIAALIKN